MIKAFRILWLDKWIPKTHLPLFISNYENFFYFHFTVLGFWHSTGKKYFLLSPLDLALNYLKMYVWISAKLSTTDALIDMCIYLQNQKAQKNITNGIFIVLKKAFDTVDHEIFLQKLAHFGIRSTPLNLFSDNLTNRF